MLEFSIVVAYHPVYPDITYTALRWEDGNAISWVNVDLPLIEVEATLKTYIGSKEMDNLDFLVALKLVREWKKANGDIRLVDRRIAKPKALKVPKSKIWAAE